MKDIMQKLAELEATAPKVTKKKMLNEDSTTPPMNVSSKPASLKDMFEMLSENVAPGQKPLPVMDPANKQAGMGFVTSNNPSVQNILKNLDPKDVQIVQAPGQPGQPQVGQQQQTTQPNQAGATGQPMQQGQMQMKEAFGEKTIVTYLSTENGDYDVEVSYDFDDYGDVEITGVVDTETGDDMYDSLTGHDLDSLKSQVEGSILDDRDDRGDFEHEMRRDRELDEEQLDELSPATLGSYTKKASTDLVGRTTDHDYMTGAGHNLHDKAIARNQRKGLNRHQGISKAVDKMTGNARVSASEGKKVDRMVKHIEKSERKLGKSKDKAEDIAWATANKRGMLDNKNKKKVKEADIPSTHSQDTMGAGLGAGRSATTLESKSISKAVDKSEKQRQSLIKKAARELNSKTKPTTAEQLVKKYDLFPKDAAAIKKMAKELSKDKVEEGKKPDFLDLDKDGNKKEPMKKAAADKKKKKVDESMNHRISAARLEGKSHGLRGHAHSGKRYEDLEELKAYHEGFKEGMDELYEMGMYETAPAATVPGMASVAMPAMEDEFDEGNAFTAALAKTPKGGKFTVGGKTFTDRTSYDTKVDEYAFEAWDRELNNLLNEGKDKGEYYVEKDEDTNDYCIFHTDKGDGKSYGSYSSKAAADKACKEKNQVNEGLSVSISKGQQNSPDSVTITAQDAEAEHLLAFVKNAGLGLFGDDNADTHSSAMSVQPAHGSPDEVGAGGVDVEVVDGHDGMMGLMQKLSGIQSDGAEDYADEEGDEEQLYGNHKETHEETCNECGGMMEAGHSCGSQMDEEETEDQEEFEVAEDNAPDSDEAETSADEDAEAKEDASLAGEEEEEVNESFFDLLGRLNKLAESKEEDEDEDKWYDKDGKVDPKGAFDAGDHYYPERDVKEDADDSSDPEDLTEWANQTGKGPGKGTDASFEQDIDFMTKVISGGLNKPKSTGQTTAPVIAGQTERMSNPKEAVTESVSDWVKLAGIK